MASKVTCIKLEKKGTEHGRKRFPVICVHVSSRVLENVIELCPGRREDWLSELGVSLTNVFI